MILILVIQVEDLLGGNLNVNDTGSAVAEFSSDHHQRYSKITPSEIGKLELVKTGWTLANGYPGSAGF